VIIIGGKLTLAQQEPKGGPGQNSPYYLKPEYGQDPAINPKIGPLLTPIYIEYFGANNVPDCSTDNPVLPTYAQWPAIGNVTCNSQPDVADENHSGVTIKFTSSGTVALYQRGVGPVATCFFVPTGASSANGDIVPSAAYSLDMKDPFTGAEVKDSCNDCDKDEPNPKTLTFTAHSPKTVVLATKGATQWYSLNGVYTVSRDDAMQVVDPLGFNGGNSGMPDVLVNEQWTGIFGGIKTNAAGAGWKTEAGGYTLNDGQFSDGFSYTTTVYDPYNGGLNPPVAGGNQFYWAGTYAIDGSSGLSMSTWINQYWIDNILRNGK